MFGWLLTHYKAVIAYTTALLTVVTVPMWFAAAAFIMRTEITNAAVPRHEERITRLEQTIYTNEERNKRMEAALLRIEEREYQELKQARQSRLGNKP